MTTARTTPKRSPWQAKRVGHGRRLEGGPYLAVREQRRGGFNATFEGRYLLDTTGARRRYADLDKAIAGVEAYARTALRKALDDLGDV